MATKETITFDSKLTSSCFNISKKVGPNCENEEGDVLVVQAMFAFLGKFSPQALGLHAMHVRREPDGVFDHSLGATILAYQRLNVRRMLNVDGIIHPASYQGRILRTKEPRIMTIQSMHYDCLEASVLGDTQADYMVDILTLFPKLNGKFTDLTKPSRK